MEPGARVHSRRRPVSDSDLGVVCRGGAWGQVEILATGSRVRMAVNGVALLDYTDPNPELISAGP